MCTSQGAINSTHVLASIRKAGIDAKPSPAGAKCICLYYTGHGEELLGDWCFQDGTITL